MTGARGDVCSWLQARCGCGEDGGRSKNDRPCRATLFFRVVERSMGKVSPGVVGRGRESTFLRGS